MRDLENYELVVSGDTDEKLLLTFDWEDLSNLPRAATSATVDTTSSKIIVVFEDDRRWEEISCLELPGVLQDMMRDFPSIFIVGLSSEVEMFSEVPLTFI